KKGPLVFVTAAPKKATGGVTPVADYQKSIAGYFCDQIAAISSLRRALHMRLTAVTKQAPKR
ncbi:MAG: hypothetical protein WB685_18210, partial [Pseudolabrys sp.]